MTKIHIGYGNELLGPVEDRSWAFWRGQVGLVSSKVKSSVLMIELAYDIVAISFLFDVMYYWRELGSDSAVKEKVSVCGLRNYVTEQRSQCSG